MIDFHTHFRSQAFFRALAKATTDPAGPAEKLRAVAVRAGLELPSPETRLHLERWIEELESCNVRHAVSVARVPEETAAMSEAASLAPDRLSPFALFDPRAEGAVQHARDLFVDHGFRGLWLLPALHHYRLDGPELAATLEALVPFRPCIVVGCGMLRLELHDLFGLPRRYRLDLADPLHLVPTADRFGEVRFVLASMGGGRLRETLMVGTQCPNVCVETSGAGAWIFTQPAPLALPDVFERVLGVYGPGRVLFGTGSGTFPPGWRREEFVAQREALGACGLRANEREAIFDSNAAQILGLESQEA